MKNSISENIGKYALSPMSGFLNWFFIFGINFILVSKLASYVTKLTSNSLFSRSEVENKYLLTLALLIAINVIFGRLLARCSFEKWMSKLAPTKKETEIENKE